jgi:import inner membrane translocase subunit TIM16
VQRYKHMIEVNKKYGSFYLESKVYRAWESLDQHYTEEGMKTPEDEEAARKLLHQEAEAAQQQQQQQESDQQQRQ